MLLKNSLPNYPVVIITGARQVGKSTFLKNDENLTNWKYITLDDFDLLRQANDDREVLWLDSESVIIDEAQKAPKILSAIKKSVDEAKNKKRFIISGSANLLLMKNITETLAGRAAYMILPPMAYSEAKGLGYNQTIEKLLNGEKINNHYENLSISEILIKGFMPPLLRFSNINDIPGWWESYTMTYLERDLRELSQIESLLDFRNLMKILALRTGKILNQSDAARDAAISQPTAHRYINLLQTSHIIELVPAYFRNRTKRLVKSPKVFWLDPSLAIYLAGYYDKKSLESSREFGSFYESLVYHHLRILTDLLKPKAKIYYWRTISGQEVDFVIEYGSKILAVEAKLTEKVKYQDAENLKIFLEEYPDTSIGLVIYNGSELKYLDKKIIAVPISNIL
jgi:predicted AAA+ superfamily ATPase